MMVFAPPPPQKTANDTKEAQIISERNSSKVIRTAQTTAVVQIKKKHNHLPQKEASFTIQYQFQIKVARKY